MPNERCDPGREQEGWQWKAKSTPRADPNHVRRDWSPIGVALASISSVEDRDVVLAKRLVARDDRQTFDRRDGDNEPIERISMMTRKGAYAFGVVERHRQFAKSTIRDGLRRMALRAEFAERRLDDDLPRGSGADPDLGRVLDGCARVAAESRVVRVPPDQGAGIEQEGGQEPLP